MEEYMFLGLRKMKGVSKQRFAENFGSTIEQIYGNVLLDMKNTGLLEEVDGFVRLTDRGIDVSNYVMSEFIL